jgi:hypothetical protein
MLGTELRVETDPARVRSETSEVVRLVSSPQRARGPLGWQAEVELRDRVPDHPADGAQHRADVTPIST